MPFETTREVPREVKDLPAGARKVWMAAFTKAVGQSPEEMAGDLAFAALKKVFTQENGKWIARKKGEEEGREEGDDLETPQDPNLGLSPDDPDYDPAAAVTYELELAAHEEAQAGDPDGEEPLAEGELEAGGLEGEAEGAIVGEEEVPLVAEGEEDPDPSAAAEEEATAAEETAAMARAKAKFRAKMRAKMEAMASETGDSVQLQMTEFFALDAKSFRLTQDGYLVSTPRVARTGIQIYKGWEVGKPEMADVRVYRPEGEVFQHAAMASLAHRPITLDHPETKVDASNWRALSVGHSTGEVARDGDFIRVPLVLMDAHAIAAAQEGKSQLSVGYGAKLVWGPGQAPDGQLYDAMQSEIRANHIALVSSARGGEKLKIGDRKSERRKGSHNDGKQRRQAMAERTLSLDGVSIELESRDAQVLERYMDNVLKKQKDQNAEADALKAQIAELQAKLAEALKKGAATDGQIEALKKDVEDGKLTPEKLDKALEVRMDTVDRAMSFYGDSVKYVWRGKPDAQIRRDVVGSRLGDAKTKPMNDDAIEGAFLSITEPETQDGFKTMTASFSKPPAGGYNDAAAKAYDKRNEELSKRFMKNRKAFGATA